MITSTPTWYDEAKQQNIDFIVFVYNRNEGFAFCPTNLEKPFFCGGDDYAHGLVTAEIALDIYYNDMGRELRKTISWFSKYIEKVYLGEDFSLEELEIQKHNLRTISGKWPW